MPSDFFYFLSSLPLLRFDDKSAMSYSEFLAFAQEKLTPQESSVLAELTLCPPSTKTTTLAVVEDWNSWETFVRNALVVLRSKDNKSDATNWLRAENGYFADTHKRLEEILVLPNAWEKEQALDQLRWQKLDELQGVHSYDFTAVIIYAYRLLLLTRQASWNEELGGKAFAAMLEKAAAAADSCRVKNF